MSCVHVSVSGTGLLSGAESGREFRKISAHAHGSCAQAPKREDVRTHARKERQQRACTRVHQLTFAQYDTCTVADNHTHSHVRAREHARATHTSTHEHSLANSLTHSLTHSQTHTNTRTRLKRAHTSKWTLALFIMRCDAGQFVCGASPKIHTCGGRYVGQGRRQVTNSAGTRRWSPAGFASCLLDRPALRVPRVPRVSAQSAPM